MGSGSIPNSSLYVPAHLAQWFTIGPSYCWLNEYISNVYFWLLFAVSDYLCLCSQTVSQKTKSLQIFQFNAYNTPIKLKNQYTDRGKYSFFFLPQYEKRITDRIPGKSQQKNTGINIIIFSALTEHLYKTEAKTPV